MVHDHDEVGVHAPEVSATEDDRGRVARVARRLARGRQEALRLAGAVHREGLLHEHDGGASEDGIEAPRRKERDDEERPPRAHEETMKPRMA
jgi:hypothetical protein